MWFRFTYRPDWGGLRPQLGPDVVAQRGPKMPQKSPLWRITRRPAAAFLGPQKAQNSPNSLLNGPPGICPVRQMASPPLRERDAALL